MAQHNHPLPPPPTAQTQHEFPHYQHHYQPQYQQSYQQQSQLQEAPAPAPQAYAVQPPTRKPPHTKHRSFSFRSDKSQKSSGSNNKTDLHETAAEKESHRLHTKADPTFAMNEAEPSAVAAAVGTMSLRPLRELQHRDSYGNPIAEPDRSNPTRSRWERPLDTIRSFEAAIDGGYGNRMSYMRSDTDSIANLNRPTSFYGGNNARFPPNSYYGGRPASFRPDSSVQDLRQGGVPRDNYQDGSNFNGPPNPPKHRHPRMVPEIQFSNARGDQNVYPIPSNHRSYETVASFTGSGSYAEPAGYQTDPTSSDNSSVERMQAPRPPVKRQPDPVNDYGIGFSQNPAYQSSNFAVGLDNSQNVASSPSNGGEHGPPVPQKRGSILRKASSKLGQQPSPAEAQRPGMGEKRKSWFSRRFNKNS